MRRLIAISCWFVLARPAAAQHQLQGQQDRDIKAMSTEEVKQYLSGRRHGLCEGRGVEPLSRTAACLELADPLGLSAEQRSAIKRLMDSHKAEARAIGARLVEAERSLEALFRSGKANEAI